MLADAPAPPPTFTTGRQTQVFVAKRDGGVHKLTRKPESHFSPVWSHRGLRIAVSAGPDVEIRSLDGAVRHRIRGGRYFAGPVAWAPHDNRIAFVAYRPTAPGEFSKGVLVVTDVDGGHRRVVAQDADGQPAWADGGRTLVYRHGQLESRKDKTLFAVPARGGTPRRIATAVAEDSRVLASPDGRLVLFFRNAYDAARRGLWVIRPDGSRRRRVLGGIDVFPYSYGWTLGGRAIFGGKRRGHPVVATLAGERRTLRVKFRDDNYGAEDKYDLTQDAGRVVWANDYPGEVRSARADGRGRRTVAHFAAKWNYVGFDSLAWSPDGRRMVFEVLEQYGD